MRESTRHRLLELNRRFYARHAAAFNTSRRHPWAGWDELPRHLPSPIQAPVSVLDVGCGNARFATFLLERLAVGVVYDGLDESAELLGHAGRRLAEAVAEGRITARLSQLDVVGQDVSHVLSRRLYDLVAVFAVLHHIPGSDARTALLARLADLVAPRGILVASLWRFDRLPGLPDRLVSWESYNRHAQTPIDLAEVEDGDHLLTWAGDRQTPRYCHLFSEAEIGAMVDACALTLRDRFQADGRGHDLNDYLVLGRHGRMS